MRRANIALPEELVEEIDRIAGKRKRNWFIAQAIQEKLVKIRFDQALAQATGRGAMINTPI